ncbi:hypothetical protein A3A66_03655 [Microgenomates group bacterium RIFCSPLOWO2_01_FULL_46_13]|nr:MAG: hypothetical protein A2783_03735 [Microgenomates group bacterium RIFCSPHIGHO2_01_FULL_45_11]OGV95163.1 MAG: hypothetical protein A3A66_03655 [Microgenomates group bacterium RIFCSPLOWO2_01_FULL_46_13]
MATFYYKVMNVSRKFEMGSLTASTKEEAAAILQKRNLKIFSIKKEAKSVLFNRSIPVIEKITFVRYLSTMLNSGISLGDGMVVLENEVRHPMMKKIIADVVYGLNQGQQLSTIFVKYPSVFDRLFVTLTRAGEVSGTLADSFSYLEEGLRAEYTLSQKIKGALLYPGIVFIAMIGIAILMFFFILPQIGKVFLNMNLPLPKATRLLFSTSIAISQYTFVVIFGLVATCLGLFLFLKSSRGKGFISAIISPAPIVKTIMRQVDLARFTRIFSTLIRSAVPITEALEIALDSLSWAHYRSMAKDLSEQIRKGKSMADTFRGQKEFPSILTQMIATGEKSGTLDKTLADLATFYEQEVEESVKNATQLLEPLLMLLVGIGVGAVILSIISPLYSVVGSLQQVQK